MNLRPGSSLRLASFLLVSGATVALAALGPSCGGGKGESGGGTTTPDQGNPGGDLDTSGTAAEADAGVPLADAALPPAPVTFVLKNTATDELAFNMNKGWQPNIFAYSGKPPHAKSILMFATYCTAACSAADEERCPVCEEPDKVKAVIAAQKFEKVAAGAELEVPWDGQVFGYQKGKGVTNGKKTRCQCYATQPAPPETYTVKACGLRLTTQAGTPSVLQCAEGSMTLPSQEPIRVELEFPAPPAPSGKKKHHGRHH
jgi:hypothetical protein